MRRLTELFHYEETTGQLFRKYADGRWKETSSKLDSNGYKRIQYNGKRTEQHRLVWYIMTGKWPLMVDHINGLPYDNRWSNLREVNHSLNGRNMKLKKTNTSGWSGVGWCKSRKMWRSTMFGKHLGYFNCPTSAGIYRKLEERRLGFHVNHGRECAD